MPPATSPPSPKPGPSAVGDARWPPVRASRWFAAPCRGGAQRSLKGIDIVPHLLEQRRHFGLLGRHDLRDDATDLLCDVVHRRAAYVPAHAVSIARRAMLYRSSTPPRASSRFDCLSLHHGSARPADNRESLTRRSRSRPLFHSHRASCENHVRPNFCLRRRGERGSADGTQRSQDGSDRHRRPGAGDAGVHGACLPVMRASTREETRRISFTSRSSSRLFSIHSR